MLLSQTMTKEAAVNLVLGQKVLFFNTYHEKKKTTELGVYIGRVLT